MRSASHKVFYPLYIALLVALFIRVEILDHTLFHTWDTILMPLLALAMTLYPLVHLAYAHVLGVFLGAVITSVGFIAFMLRTEVFSLGGGALLILPGIVFIGTLIVLGIFRIFFSLIDRD